MAGERAVEALQEAMDPAVVAHFRDAARKLLEVRAAGRGSMGDSSWQPFCGRRFCVVALWLHIAQLGCPSPGAPPPRPHRRWTRQKTLWPWRWPR